MTRLSLDPELTRAVAREGCSVGRASHGQVPKRQSLFGKGRTAEEAMLLVCLDEQGKASGSMYWDAGDGWSYQKGDYSLQQYTLSMQAIKSRSEKRG